MQSENKVGGKPVANFMAPPITAATSGYSLQAKLRQQQKQKEALDIIEKEK